jgi:hypothetical protein
MGVWVSCDRRPACGMPYCGNHMNPVLDVHADYVVHTVLQYYSSTIVIVLPSTSMHAWLGVIQCVHTTSPVVDSKTYVFVRCTAGTSCYGCGWLIASHSRPTLAKRSKTATCTCGCGIGTALVPTGPGTC